MKTKKVKAAILAVAMMATGTISCPAINANANTNEVASLILLGDANGDGNITLSDANYIQRYLNGQIQPSTTTKFTAMDYNEDMIIDNYDADLIMHDYSHGSISYTYVTKNPYDLLNNEARSYRKHTCSLTNTTSYSTYSLSTAPSYLTLSYEDENIVEQTRLEVVDDENVPCVYLAIKKADNTMDYVSGVVVGDHIIATAAHNLYDNGYAKKISVDILNQYCSTNLLSFDASTIHIPSLYFTSSSPESYDYGLIYTSENLSSYKANIGTMTDTFMNSGNDLVTSGFTLQYGVRRRFKSQGAVQFMSGTPSQVPYRFHSGGVLTEGKQGGMVYYETTADINTFVGIGTNRDIQSGVIVDTYGIRITPTILRFFYQNGNLA